MSPGVRVVVLPFRVLYVDGVPREAGEELVLGAVDAQALVERGVVGRVVRAPDEYTRNDT